MPLLDQRYLWVIDLLRNRSVQGDQVLADIASNALVMFDHGFVKGKSGRGCCGGIGCQTTLRRHDREPRQSQRLI